MKRVLIVDDEPSVLSALQCALRQRLGGDIEIATEPDAMLALDLLRQTHHDVVISGMRMRPIDGVAFLRLASAVAPESVRMILTAPADVDAAQRAMQDAGVFRCLIKPWSDAEVAAHVRAALAQAQRIRPLQQTG